MIQDKYPSTEKTNEKSSDSSKLEEERQEQLKNINEFSKKLEDLKVEVETNLNKEVDKEKLNEIKKKLNKIKEVEQNIEITKDIFRKRDPKELNKLTFFHNYGSVDMLVTFCKQDSLDLS
jgi:chromosome segregation ATPase